MIGDGPIGVYERHAMVELGGIEADAGRCQSAVSVLKKVRQSLSADSSPDSPAPLLEPTIYRLGVCAFKLDRFDESAALFEELIAAFPASPLLASASYYAGDARFRAGRFDAAAAHFERIIDRFERDAVFEPALLRLGDCWIHLQRWAVAERTFAKYLNRFADADQWFQAQFGVGLARENQRRYDDAINAYRAVVARHTGPTAARAQFQIGECLFAQDRFADAVRELLKVDILYAYPEWSAAALYESARCFEKMNMVGEAREHFQRVSQKHGDSRWAQPATQRLSELSSASVPGR
jgi:TolA-binding protein